MTNDAGMLGLGLAAGPGSCLDPRSLPLTCGLVPTSGLSPGPGHRLCSSGSPPFPSGSSPTQREHTGTSPAWLGKHSRCEEARLRDLTSPPPSQADMQFSSWGASGQSLAVLAGRRGRPGSGQCLTRGTPVLSFGAHQSFLGIALGEVGVRTPAVPEEGRAPSLRRTGAAPSQTPPAPRLLGATASPCPPSPACAFHFCPVYHPAVWEQRSLPFSHH